MYLLKKGRYTCELTIPKISLNRIIETFLSYLFQLVKFKINRHLKCNKLLSLN